ncbi:recombinase family protein [Curtobacterium flaccumfaciens]|uniref:recombinase family protein n=1 Tax=Curtobacterium flaccumfaciens TaxID=2035 RepID=UPI0036F37138
MSGSLEHRPALDKLLDQIPPATLVVWRLDRLGRSSSRSAPMPASLRLAPVVAPAGVHRGCPLTKSERRAGCPSSRT